VARGRGQSPASKYDEEAHDVVLSSERTTNMLRQAAFQTRSSRRTRVLAAGAISLIRRLPGAPSRVEASIVVPAQTINWPPAAGRASTLVAFSSLSAVMPGLVPRLSGSFIA
jgi:hypothetical protein